MSHAKTVIDTYLKALVDGDLDAIVGIYAVQATVEDPVGSTPIQGLEAIRKFYYAAVGSIQFAGLLGPIREAANEVAFPFEIGIEMQGHAMKIEIIDTFKFDAEGKVVQMRAFWSQKNMVPRG